MRALPTTFGPASDTDRTKKLTWRRYCGRHGMNMESLCMCRRSKG